MDCAIKELAEGEVFHHVAILEGLKRLFQTESPLFYIYIINTFPLYKKKRLLRSWEQIWQFSLSLPQLRI